jgi:hypothetical protein
MEPDNTLAIVAIAVTGGTAAVNRGRSCRYGPPAALREEIAARPEAVTSPFRTAEPLQRGGDHRPSRHAPDLCDWAERAHELVRHELH